MDVRIALLYATQTGVSKSLAENMADLLSKYSFSVDVLSFDDIANVEDLRSYRLVIFVCSSTGQGDPPDTAAKFFRQLRRLNLTKSTVLSNMRYTLLGLGDSNYQTFGAFPKALHKILQSLGGTTFYDFCLADDAVGLDLVVEPWLSGFLPSLEKELGMSSSFEGNTSSVENSRGDVEQGKSAVLVSKTLVPPANGWKLPVIATSVFDVSFEKAVHSIDRLEFEESYYKALSLFGASSSVVYLPIRSTATLTSPDAIKAVNEICLDGTLLPTVESLQPGDSFSVICTNDEEEVRKLLERLNLTDVADLPLVFSPKIPSHLQTNGASLTLRNCLLFCVDIRSAPKKVFLRLMANSCPAAEKAELEYLSSFEGTADFSAFVREAQLSLLDLLLLFPSIHLTAAQLIENLPPLKPRSYSVANFPPNSSPREVRFAFSTVHLPIGGTRRQYARNGVCTRFLLDAISKYQQNSAATLPVFTRTSQAFRLPPDMSTPIILVSAGTGIAPYVGFFEYLEGAKASMPEIWLFHGCRNRDKDLIYRDQIYGWAKKGVIKKLALACSRQDPLQPDGSPTYVQNRLLEHGKDLMELNPPATIYVCGDAAKMAPLLRETLVAIIQEHTGCSKEESLATFKQWTKSGRYKEDVWSQVDSGAMARYFLTCCQNPLLRMELFADGSNEYAIGRGYENNIILVRNKLISRRHCQLFKEPDKTVRLMADSDVNGVVINDRLLIFSGESVSLHSNDKFYIVHSRKHPEQNLSFTLFIERNSNETSVDDIEELAALGISVPATNSNSSASVAVKSSSSSSVRADPENSVALEDDKAPSSVTPTRQEPSTSYSNSGISTATKAALKPEAQLSSSLQCSICLSILYDPVTLAPCMHNFCAGCCSGWLASNRRCPSCRHKISFLSKNPSLRAILDSYVATNPSQAKSEEERIILDAANRLKFDRPFLPGSVLPLNDHGDPARRNEDQSNPSDATNATSSVDQSHTTDDDSDDDDDDLSDSDDDDDDSDDDDQANGWPLGSDTEIEETEIPERHEYEHDSNSTNPVCRQCLPAAESGNGNGVAKGKGKSLSNSNSDAALSSTAAYSNAFHCSDPLQHVLCNCCDSPMPDRRTDIGAPPQTCFVCSLEFCNLYWPGGCQNGQCQPGCLKYLKDIDLKTLTETNSQNSDSSTALILFGNVFETNKLREYLQQKSIAAPQLRDILLDGLASGKYSTKSKSLIGDRPGREMPVCSFCRVNIVQDLLFAYCRENRDLLIDRRPNCPHGRYCVSQSEDLSHATAVNHICEPSPPGIVIDCATFGFSKIEHDSSDNNGNKAANIRDHMDLD